MIDKLSANLILIKTFFIRDMKIFASISSYYLQQFLESL